MSALERGQAYLERVRRSIAQPSTIATIEILADRDRIYEWIGAEIDRISQSLDRYLTECHGCFFPEQRRQIQILAAPFDRHCGVIGCCNINTEPISIFIDIGQVAPQDWLAPIAHEYVHAHLKKPGHDLEFARTLNHLCLGLGLTLPPDHQEDTLKYHPPCTPTIDPLSFWRGELCFARA
jgi:hypothetical protein